MKSLLRALFFLHLLTLTLAGCKQWVMKLPQAIHRYPFVRVTSVQLVNPSTPVPVANLRACHSMCDKVGCKAFAFFYDQLLCSISEAYKEDGPRILTPDTVQARKDLGLYVAVPHDQDKMPYCPSRETYGRYLAQDVLPWLFPDPTTTPALPVAASSSARPSSSTAPKDTTATQTSSSPTASSSSKATTPSGGGPSTSTAETRTSASSTPSSSSAPTSGSAAPTSTSPTPSQKSSTPTASVPQKRTSPTTTEESVSSPSSLTSSQSTSEADTSELPVDETSTRAKTTSGEASSTPAPLSTSTTTTTQMPPSTLTTTSSDAPSSTASSSTSTTPQKPTTTVTEAPSTSTTTRQKTTTSERESTTKGVRKTPCTIIVNKEEVDLADGEEQSFKEPINNNAPTRITVATTKCRVNVTFTDGSWRNESSTISAYGRKEFTWIDTRIVKSARCDCGKPTSAPRATTTTETEAPTTSGEIDTTSTSTRPTTTTPEDPIYAGFVMVGSKRFDVPNNVAFKELYPEKVLYSKLDGAAVSVTVFASCEVTLEMGLGPNTVPLPFNNMDDGVVSRHFEDVELKGYDGIQSARGRCANRVVPERANGW